MEKFAKAPKVALSKLALPPKVAPSNEAPLLKVAPPNLACLPNLALKNSARPLKVEFADKQWRIPSHHNYRADAEDRLSKTAAALMELRKDAIVTERVEDHAEYGVIDPLGQEVTSLTGRGKRVTLPD